MICTAKAPITVHEAALGAKLEVLTIDGEAQLKNSAGHQQWTKVPVAGNWRAFGAQPASARRSVRRSAGRGAQADSLSTAAGADTGFEVRSDLHG